MSEAGNGDGAAQGVVKPKMTPRNMDRIIEQHLLGGRPVDALVFHRGPGAGDDC